MVVIVNLTLGMITPPVGGLLFVTSVATKVPLMALTRELPPFLWAHLVVLVLLTFVPAISTWLPAVSGLAVKWRRIARRRPPRRPGPAPDKEEKGRGETRPLGEQVQLLAEVLDALMPPYLLANSLRTGVIAVQRAVHVAASVRRSSTGQYRRPRRH